MPGPYSKIFLDTNVLIRHPEILSRKKAGLELLIPDAVYAELSRGSGFQTVKEVLDDALSKGYVKRVKSPVFYNRSRRVKNADMALLAAAAAAGPGTAIATDDRDFTHTGPTIGVDILTSSELTNLLSNAEVRSEELRVRADKARRWMIITASAVVAAIIPTGIILSRGAQGLNWVLAHFGIAAAVLALPVGLGLFLFRSRSPFWYGLTEVTFGIAAVGAASVNLPAAPIDFQNFGPLMTGLGGVYIIVRGLDNMSKGADRTIFAPFFAWFEGS